MSHSYYYFMVEGVHDVAAVSKILKLYGFNLIEHEEYLDTFWKRMIPTSFPHNGNLLKRVPIPQFFQNESASIAVNSIDGETEIIKGLEMIDNLDHRLFSGIAIFCDADSQTASDKFQQLKRKIVESTDLNKEIKEIVEENEFDTVGSRETKFGIFVFPNNNEAGTLEDLLLEGASVTYADLETMAENYIQEVENLNPNYIKESSFNGAKRKKVKVGVMANFFKPGKANQVSIQENDWLCKETTNFPNQARFVRFIKSILNLE